jgi:hypothetical protein
MGVEMMLDSFLTSEPEGMVGQHHAPAALPWEKPGARFTGCSN